MNKNAFIESKVKSIWLKPTQRVFRWRMMLKHAIRAQYGLLRRAMRRATEEGLVQPKSEKTHVELLNA